MQSVFAIYTTGKDSPRFTKYSSEEVARSSGNGFALVKTQDDLSDKRIFPTSSLIDIYNNWPSNREISKFRDRATAEKKVWAMLQEFGDACSAAESECEKRVLDKGKTTKENSSPNKKPRKSAQYAGKKIYALVDKNPRKRVNSYGWRSMEILLNCGEVGIPYEDYLARGGRSNDLKWDIDRNWAEVR